MAGDENNDNNEFSIDVSKINNNDNNNNYKVSNLNICQQLQKGSPNLAAAVNETRPETSGMAHQHQQQPDVSPAAAAAAAAPEENKSKPATNNNDHNKIIENNDNNNRNPSDAKPASSSPQQNPAQSTSGDNLALISDNETQQRTSTTSTDLQSSCSISTTTTTNQVGEQVTQQVPLKQQQPQAANNRSILILRDIEPDCSESSVKNIFNSENCPSKPVHCEYALHNSWYVTFKDDEDARQALNYIRKYIVKWNGQPIMARYKPKPAGPSAGNHVPSSVVPHMVMQQQQLDSNVNISPAPSSSSSTSLPPAVNIIGAAGLAHPGSSASMLNSAGGPILPASTTPAPITTNPAISPSLLIYHPQNHSMLHHHHHHNLHPNHHHHQQAIHHHHHHNQLHHNPHHHHPHHHNHQQQQQQPYGFSAVAYYGQHGPIMTPYQNPQYDLSEVFIYNGLTPYPTVAKSSNQKIFSNGGGGIAKAALLGGGGAC